MRNNQNSSKKRIAIACLLASTAIGISSPAIAQSAEDDRYDDEIVVTAQKREQNLQDVPISIQAIGEERLENAQVSSFDDYAKLLPSVSFQSFGPSQAQIAFRGVTSGADGLHVGPLPTASLYIDETPVTTIAGSVDFHVYDIARVEALSGPQGTLFGASSLSGTLRIITNKPDSSAFSGAVDAEINKFGKGDFGGTLEGYLNFPLNEKMALRIVGFYEKKGGYIDNIPGTRTFTLDDNDPTTNLTVDNSALVEDNYNDVVTYGGRAALKIDLDDNWTVTPQIIYQRQKSNGGFLFDPAKGDLKVTDYLPSQNKDEWFQAALTIEGKLSDWDIVYSGSYFERRVDNFSDYSYYSVVYDTYTYDSSGVTVYPGATFFQNGDGSFIDPSQYSHLNDKYTKQTHELRLSSPVDKPFRLTTGLFMQRQTDYILADYYMPGLGSVAVNNWLPVFPAPQGNGDAVYITRVNRVDRDYAAFGQAEYDITPTITVTGGIRAFMSKNTIFGFSGTRTNGNLATCLTPIVNTGDRPCDNVDKKSDQAGVTYKGNIKWQITPDAMIYGTISRGFRPGGNNRRPGVDPFKADTLTNYEVGLKTSFGPFTFNAAGFYQEWKDVQFSLVPLGQNGQTNTYNAGDAEIYGLEADIGFRSGGFSLYAAGSYVDAKLVTDLCQIDPVTKNIVCNPGDVPQAAAGTRLPVQPKLKISATTRYEMPIGDETAFVQASLSHQGNTRTFLADDDFALAGPTAAFTTFDFSVGTSFDSWRLEAFIQNAFDKRGILSVSANCAISACFAYARDYPIKPQIFGLKIGTEF